MSKFSDSCIAALKKDIDSGEYASESEVLQHGINALQDAKDLSIESQEQIAIGIYNWLVRTKTSNGYTPRSNDVQSFLARNPLPISPLLIIAEENEISDGWQEYFLELGNSGVTVSPSKFIEILENNDSKKPLPHLQQALLSFNSKVFHNDAYDCSCYKDAYQKITLEDIKKLVANAVKEYINYHENSVDANNRGLESGFFSKLRHTAKGIIIARDFNDVIREEATSLNAITKLKNFLENSARTYHNHSFASYLADALAQKELVTSHENGKYNQVDLIEELNYGISTIEGLYFKPFC